MRTCGGCQSEVPNDAETCPRCGNLGPRGMLSSLLGLFRGKPAPPPALASASVSAPVEAAPRARDVAGAFSMKCEDVFTIQGRGTVVTGRITSGEIHVGDEVLVMSKKGAPIKCAVIGVEMVGKVVKVAHAGDDAGLLLRAVTWDQIEAGTTITQA